MGVRKRRGVYYIDYYVEGQRVREAVGPNKKQAEQVLTQRKAEVLTGKHKLPSESKMSFYEATGEYMRWAKDHKRSWRDDDAILKRVGDDLSDLQLGQITAWHIEKIKHRLRKEGLSGPRVNRYLACLSGLFHRMQKWNLYSGENPLRQVERFRENPARQHYYVEEEIDRLLGACCNELKEIVITALNTGMRRSEIFTLEKEYVDLNVRNIHIKDSKSGKSRDIPINDVLLKTLQLILSRNRGRLVFCRPDGSPWISEMRTAWLKATKRAGFPTLRFHDLRHIFASRLAMKGVPLNVIKELLGHSTLEMTLRYAHLSPGAKQAAVQMMAETFSKTATGTMTQCVGHKLGTNSNFSPKIKLAFGGKAE